MNEAKNETIENELESALDMVLGAQRRLLGLMGELYDAPLNRVVILQQLCADATDRINVLLELMQEHFGDMGVVLEKPEVHPSTCAWSAPAAELTRDPEPRDENEQA